MPAQEETDEDASESTDADLRDQEVEPETESEQLVEGVSFALIHEAASLTDFDQLEDPDSIASQVARGRGKGRVEDRVEPDDEDNGNSPAEYQVTVEEGRLKTDSGYVVRFVEEEHLNLSPFDVAALDTVKAYPAPEKLIENLTPRIRGYLKEHGYVQVRGAYSAGDSRFYGVQMGWDLSDEIDPWDRLMEVIGQVSTTPAALDYVFVEEGPDRWDVDEVARVRGIEPASVRGNVRAIENELDR